MVLNIAGNPGMSCNPTTTTLSEQQQENDLPIVNESHHGPDQNITDPHRTAAMISAVEQLQITGGNFTQINNNYHDVDHPLKHVAFQTLPRSRDAVYDASINLDNLSRRRCTDGTRVDIIAEIMAWVNENDPAKAPPVYWLTGLAGLGKTTIAYSICELLDEAHLPFVSFFCSLQLDSKNSKLIVPTLCRELAGLYKSYAASVLPVLEKNPKVVDSGLRIQIDQLLAKSWQASMGKGQDHELPTPIVVVDALDECDHGSEFLEELLRVIRRSANELAGIKFLVTSRPDPKIVNICKSFPPNVVCKLHEVDLANVQSDIEKYLWEALPELKDDPELALLSKRAGGLFIYATTAVKFISPPHSPPSVSEMRSHLQVMLNPGSLTSHADSDERLLVDELYERILGFAFRDARVRPTRLRILHTIVCAESRIDISVLADLMNIDKGTVERVVESLHAVLFVSSKDGCVYWYHASFPDFLFSRARAKISLSLPGNRRPLEFDVFCDASARHCVLALRCLSEMHKSLHFNMCNLPSSHIMDCEVPDLNASIDKTISLTLRYASRQWARHLFRVVPTENGADELLCSLKEFLDNKLLFWIEAMNLIGAKYECSSLLGDAQSWIGGGQECQPNLLGQLTDAMNFSIFFAGSEASKSTPHLYISALSTWNQDSPIWRNWKKWFAFIPSILRGSITIPLLTIPTTYSVVCMALSPDGNKILSSYYEMWDAKTGELLMKPQGRTNIVTSVAFSPDGNLIVYGSPYNSVRRWDAKTQGHTSDVNSVAVSGSSNNPDPVWVWNATTGELLWELQGHTDAVTSVAFSPNSDQIVCGSLDGSAWVWNGETGGLLRDLQGHTDNVNSVAFSPDGNRIVSGSWDRSIRLWDANTGKNLRELQGHTYNVESVAFSPDGDRIVSSSRDLSVRVWDANTGEQLRELQGHVSWVASATFSPDGDRIVSGSWDRSVRVWDAKTGEQLRRLQGHTGKVSSVTFSPDGNRIVSGSWDQSVRVWDANTGELRVLQEQTNNVNSVAFLPDGNRIVSGSEDQSVWDANTGEQLGELQGHADSVNSVAFSPDGNRIVSGSLDQSVRVWDANTGVQLRELQGHTDSVTSVAYLPDGNRIVSGSLDQSVRLWDANTGEQLRELQGHTLSIKSVAFSPDGNRVVSGSVDQSVRVWDATTGEELRLQGHANNVESVAFSPDGNRIVSGSWDKSVRVWDAFTGEQLRVLQGHVSWVTSAAFSPDGNYIVSGSYDGSVLVWDANTGEQLRDMQKYTYITLSVSFSPDGHRIVSGSTDKSVWVWDANTGERLRELRGHTDEVTSVAFSPDGNRIVSGSKDHVVRVWGNLNLDVPWVTGEDGWVLSGEDGRILSGAERLVWLPSAIRNVLLRPHNTLVISRNNATISFTQCKLGTLWHECYTP